MYNLSNRKGIQQLQRNRLLFLPKVFANNRTLLKNYKCYNIHRRSKP